MTCVILARARAFWKGQHSHEQTSILYRWARRNHLYTCSSTSGDHIWNVTKVYSEHIHSSFRTVSMIWIRTELARSRRKSVCYTCCTGNSLLSRWSMASKTYRIMSKTYRIMSKTYQIMSKTYRIMSKTYRIMNKTYRIMSNNWERIATLGYTDCTLWAFVVVVVVVVVVGVGVVVVVDINFYLELQTYSRLITIIPCYYSGAPVACDVIELAFVAHLKSIPVSSR